AGEQLKTEVVPVITKAEIVRDTTDAVLNLGAFYELGPLTVTVTASDARGNSSSRIFYGNVVADDISEPPVLRSLLDESDSTGTTVKLGINVRGLGNGPVEYEAVLQGDSAANATVSFDAQIS